MVTCLFVGDCLVEVDEGQDAEEGGESYCGVEVWDDGVVRVAGVWRDVAVFSWYGGCAPRRCGI